MTSTASPSVSNPADFCTCENSIPQQIAIHKGASRTICLTCKLPVKLAF
jgi:hypothetical protein